MSIFKEQVRAAKYPNFPTAYMPKGKTKPQSATNSLTDAIKYYCTLKQAHVERVNTQGQFKSINSMQDKEVPSVVRNIQAELGKKFVIGQWRKSGSKNGSADLHGCYKGRAFYCEVKQKNDELSEDQKKYKTSVETAGAKFFEVRSIDTFIEEFETWIKTIV